MLPSVMARAEAMESTGRMRQAANVLCRPNEEGALLVNLQSGDCWKLNKSGFLLWSKLAEGGGFDEAVSAVTEMFGIEVAIARKDAERLMCVLIEKGLIVHG